MGPPRVHLFELEDQDWFPPLLRVFLTDCLHGLSGLLGLYDPCQPVLRDLLARTASSRVVDLCSGGGGPWARLLPRLSGVRVTLTDKFPNLPAFERLSAAYPAIDYHPEPVDAREVPPSLAGARTMFTALHHLAPTDVESVFRDAVRSRVPFAAFEFNERRWHSVLLVPPTALLLCLLVTPLLSPFRLDRLLLTYLVPLVPLSLAWDGLVSQLRAYTVDELRKLAAAAGSEDYHWEVGQRSWWGVGNVTYVLGYPAVSSPGGP